MSANNKFWFAAVDRKVLMDRKLTPTDKTVFGVLCAHADKNTRKCWPKVKTIADEANCSVRSVQNSLKKLESRGIIKRMPEFCNNKQMATHYYIIGYKAECYSDMACTECGGGVQDVHTENKNQLTKDSLTREAELPERKEIPEAPAESFSPEDVPEIMRSTAEYLLLKTGRKTLTENEISALRELSANQYPSRVQKEIDRACERFRRKGNSLDTLTFCYIAGALRNQPSLKKKSRKKSEPDGMSLTQAEIDATRTEQTEEELDRELAELKAEMLEGGCE